MFNLFHYDFLVRGFLAALAIGVIAPAIGMFLVVRRQAFLADTLSHVSLAGVAVGLLAGFNPVASAIVFSLAAALLVERLRSRGGLYGDSILSLILSGSLALAVILIGIAKGFNANLFSYLFGSVTTVTASDVIAITVLGAVVLTSVLFLYKQFFLLALDEELALSGGLPAGALNAFLAVLAGLTIALALRIVGALLVGALMVVPVLAASRFGFGFRRTHLLATVFALFAVVIGFFAAYVFDLAAGGTIVAAAVGIFLCALVVGRR